MCGKQSRTASVEGTDIMSRAQTRMIQIVKADAAKQIVYGVVYAPEVMDSYGEFMFAEDIETMAHDFMRLKLDEVIDTNHDRVPNGSVPVESFIARAGDPDYPEGAWVLGVKCSDDMWDKYQRGEINAYSFEAMVVPVECDVEVTTYRDHFGVTEKGAQLEPHDHTFFVYVSKMGKIEGGFTDTAPDGHRHAIFGSCKTMAAGLDNHTHRFSL